MKNEKSISIFLIDTHALFRKGLKAILADYPNFEIIGDTSSYLQAESILQENPVDMILIDTDFYTIKNNEFFENILKKNLTKKVVALTLAKSRLEFLNAIKSGIHGFILKDEEIEFLIECIKKIYAGRFIVSESMVEKLVELLIQKSEFPINLLISNRELEVLNLIQNGYSNNQIGKHLFLSENTIKTHIKHIYKKMSVSNRKEAIEKGILWGILK
ncbi:MAG: response regulator transcription factor [Anaerolineaceae bacterium]|nr:response regulator transcription factor [Anaerolineaceae bacterium]